MNHSKRYIDVFNGDADGLCSLVQLRRADPRTSELVTGVKRDINLLQRVNAKNGDHITVLDISFEKNSKDVQRLLTLGASLDYIDHHQTGVLIKHRSLKCDINLSAETCTSLIVDKKLQGQYRQWAIVGTFGDNLISVAKRVGRQSGIEESDLDLLQQLGTYLNYNSYGENIDDLFFHPAKLYEKLCKYDSPLNFIKNDNQTFTTLASGYEQDMLKVQNMPIKYKTSNIAVILLPNEKWAKRASGVYINLLANKYPECAHAILTQKNNANYVVSIRAQKNQKQGADSLASKFPTGGGRKAAAGINDLPKNKLDYFIEVMESFFPAA